MSDRERLERAVIGLACRGRLTHAEMLAVPAEAFTHEARLFAWTCALHAVRLFGERCTVAHVRMSRVTAPRLDLPLAIWADLMRETEDEIERAHAARVDDAAYERLLSMA